MAYLIDLIYAKLFPLQCLYECCVRHGSFEHTNDAKVRFKQLLANLYGQLIRIPESQIHDNNGTEDLDCE